MIRLLADENLDNSIIRGLLRRNPDIDIVRVQDIGMCGADDPAVLNWAADEGRILLTHDVATITRHAYERLADNLVIFPTPRYRCYEKRFSHERIVSCHINHLSISIRKSSIRLVPFRNKLGDWRDKT